MSASASPALAQAATSGTGQAGNTQVKSRPAAGRRKRLSARDRILAGALIALGQRGLQKVSIEDICNASNTSRRTLYRHFKGRKEIIASVARHIREQFEMELEQAIKARPGLDDRVRVVMDQLTTYSETHKSTARLAASEIEFMRDSMTRSFGEYVEMIRRTIEPLFAVEARLVAAGLSDRNLAELIVRFAMQGLLLPMAGQKSAVDSFCAYWQLAVRGALAIESERRSEPPARQLRKEIGDAGNDQP
jgi:AcrR family transcriptional regulator